MEQHAAEQKKAEPEPEPEPEPKPKPANHAGQHEDAAAAKTPTPPPSSAPEGQQHPPPEPEPSPAQQKSVTWSRDLTQEAPPATAVPAETNPYVTPSPATSSTPKKTMESVKSVLGRWGKKMGEASRKAEDLAGNVWQHLKTGPSMADAAMGRIAQGTKVIAEGGYEKIFQQTFDMLPEEKFKKSYACYLSTSAGPVMGILYLSTAKLAFCSDSPLSYQVGDQTEWTYYKVVILLPQLKAVNPSMSKVKRTEKYIQIVSIDNHEFWFMGFVNYDSAVKNLQEALHCAHDLQPQ